MKKARNVKRGLFFAAVTCMFVLCVGCTTDNMSDTVVENSTVPAVSSTPLTATEDEQASEQNSMSLALSNVVSIKTNGTEVTAECELGRSKGLGDEMDSLNLTYYFEMVEDGGTTYYRLKSVESIH